MNIRKYIKKLIIVLMIIAAVGITKPTMASNEVKGKTYIIGMDQTMAPFTYLDEDGNPAGMEVEIFEAVAKDQGFSYKFQNFSFSAALQALESNQIDGLLAGVAATPEREKKLDFSDPFYVFGNQIAVLADSDYEDLDDLYGATIAVKSGSTGMQIIEDMKDEYKFNVLPFDSSVDMHNAVNSGIAQASVESLAVQAYGIKTGQLNFKQIGEKLNSNNYAFALNKGKNPELLKMFNAGLKNIKEEGLFDEIVIKHLGEEVLKATRPIGEAIIEEDPGAYSTFESVAKALARGLWITIWTAFVSIIIASAIGLVFGLMRVSEKKLLKYIADIYIYAMRGVPMIVFVFFIYFGVSSWLHVTFSPEVAGVASLSINTGAYIAEIVRGGIQGVAQGQFDAARSLGMSKSLTMRKIILPQAIKSMIPSLVNQFILSLKNTSILSVIGMVELTNAGKIIIARTYKSGEIWLIVGVVYIVIITLLTKVSEQIEKKLKNESKKSSN